MSREIWVRKPAATTQITGTSTIAATIPRTA